MMALGIFLDNYGLDTMKKKQFRTPSIIHEDARQLTAVHGFHSTKGGKDIII